MPCSRIRFPDFRVWNELFSLFFENRYRPKGRKEAARFFREEAVPPRQNSGNHAVGKPLPAQKRWTSAIPLPTGTTTTGDTEPPEWKLSALRLICRNIMPELTIVQLSGPPEKVQVCFTYLSSHSHREAPLHLCHPCGQAGAGYCRTASRPKKRARTQVQSHTVGLASLCR